MVVDIIRRRSPLITVSLQERIVTEEDYSLAGEWYTTSMTCETPPRPSRLVALMSAIIGRVEQLKCDLNTLMSSKNQEAHTSIR